MAKAPGIISLVLGIISLTPLTLFLGLAFWVIPVASIILGIVGIATAKENSKVPGILGIVFGGVGFFLFYIWLILLALFGLNLALLGLAGFFEAIGSG